MGLAFALLASGCATGFAPTPLDQVPFPARVQTQTTDGLTVSVAVPTREEATAIYGVDLADHGMQPVWLEVSNEREAPIWLLPSGLDPAYYAAPEAAYAYRSRATNDAGRSLDDHFASLQFRNPVPPGETVSGFVIVNRDEGFRAVDVDLVAGDDARSFTFIVFDPTFRGDYTTVDFHALYESHELVDIRDETMLRRALEELPCCTTNADGDEQGDPLNLVLIGHEDDIFPAYVRRGWHGTEIIWTDAVWRTIKSFLEGSRYRYSPVSPLYVFGRKQDLALQKARGTIHERNHLRMWLTPLRYRGKAVWVGQISRDIGVKFTIKSPTISTHVIDPDVDEARRYLLEDLAYSQALGAIAFVEGVGETPKIEPRYNLVGDPWFSDGLRTVMFLEPRPRTLEEIEFLQWETPPRSRAATSAVSN